jgi:hypothetical protein
MNPKQSNFLDFWPLFFLLTFLEAAASLLVLLRIPSEGGSLSITRLALIFLLLAAIIVTAIAGYFSWQKKDFINRWLNPGSKPKLSGILSILLPLLAIGTGIGAFLLRWWNPERSFPVFERAWPLLAFIIAFSTQSTIWILILRFSLHKTEFTARKPALIAFVILIFVFGLISLTRLGLTLDPAYWGEPGVPIQGWQFGLALIAGASFLPFSLSPFFNSNSRRVDLLIGIAIWVLAAVIWLSVPNEVLKNSFYFPIDPPANMPLPYSDSGYYDYMAHSLLIGTDYTGEIPTRPMYIVFLAILHLLFGENYNSIIAGQTVVLATFPVVFYAMGKKLHSRLAGVTIALLAIFREWTNLLVSSDTRVSNTKTLLVDTPTLLLILLTCLFAFRWLEKKDKRFAFIAGGTFGILLLLRTQSMLILPLIFIIAFLSLRANKSPWITPLVLFILGLFISITPWLTHNYLRIGKFAFDAPFQYQVLASQYAYTGNLDFESVNLEGKSLSQILITFARKDPAFVASFITNHFLATETGALLALPLIAPFNGLREPINLYWTSFDGELAWQNILLLGGYLAIISIGIGAAWKRWHWAGLVPLAFNLGYAITNGVGRFSGWRYDFPADWIAYFYFGIGFAEILLWLAAVFGISASSTEQTEGSELPTKKRNLARQLFPLAAVFALIGAVPWIAEGISPPPRYRYLTSTEIQEKIAGLQSDIPVKEIREFASQPSAIALTGRLLYPRYFGRNAGISSATPWPSYASRDFPRLGFLLLNQHALEVVFPIRGSTIGNVQAEDVLILGCEREGYIEARILAFSNADMIYLSDFGLDPCLPKN